MAGSILGLALGYFSYRQYYPSLASEISHRPYAPRIKPEGPILPTHHHNDSQATERGLGIPDHINGRHSYHDLPHEEDLELPEGTAPRPERTSMTDLWKDDDVAPAGRMESVPLA